MNDILRLAKEVRKQRRKVSENPSVEEYRLLADDLQEMANVALWQGETTNALSAVDESLSIYLRLYQTQHDAFLPYVAASLNNRARVLSTLGRLEEALAATEEAVDNYRKLAEKNPGTFLPDLAMSLNNVGNMLSELGRREEALATTEEAVDNYRKLAEKNPGTFLPDLAMSLGAHGNVLSGMGRHNDAVAVFAEGLKLITAALQKLPAAFAELSASLLRDYLASAKADEMEPNKELVEPVRKALDEYTAPKAVDSLNALLSMTEKAVKSEHPTEHEVFKALTAIGGDANAPAELRALAERLISVLNGERDRAKITVGLRTELSEAMDALLTRIAGNNITLLDNA
jgi:tetratricopeptide (TPR) repeat protein